MLLKPTQTSMELYDFILSRALSFFALACNCRVTLGRKASDERRKKKFEKRRKTFAIIDRIFLLHPHNAVLLKRCFFLPLCPTCCRNGTFLWVCCEYNEKVTKSTFVVLKFFLFNFHQLGFPADIYINYFHAVFLLFFWNVT